MVKKAQTSVGKSVGAKSAATKPVAVDSKKSARSVSKSPNKDSGKKADAKNASKPVVKRSATEPKATMAGSKRLAAKPATKIVKQLAPQLKVTGAKGAATKKPKRK